jgi:hypothetical protein
MNKCLSLVNTVMNFRVSKNGREFLDCFVKKNSAVLG